MDRKNLQHRKALLGPKGILAGELMKQLKPGWTGIMKHTGIDPLCEYTGRYILLADGWGGLGFYVPPDEDSDGAEGPRLVNDSIITDYAEGDSLPDYKALYLGLKSKAGDALRYQDLSDKVDKIRVEITAKYNSYGGKINEIQKQGREAPVNGAIAMGLRSALTVIDTILNIKPLPNSLP